MKAPNSVFIFLLCTRSPHAVALAHSLYTETGSASQAVGTKSRRGSGDPTRKEPRNKRTHYLVTLYCYLNK